MPPIKTVIYLDVLLLTNFALTLLFLLAAGLLPWFVRLVELISPKGPELEVISRQIANAHTAFNVCCTLLWLPFSVDGAAGVCAGTGR